MDPVDGMAVCWYLGELKGILITDYFNVDILCCENEIEGCEKVFYSSCLVSLAWHSYSRRVIVLCYSWAKVQSDRTQV